jgi:hypothetical protein
MRAVLLESWGIDNIGTGQAGTDRADLLRRRRLVTRTGLQ